MSKQQTALGKHISRLKRLRDLYEIGTPQHNCFSIAINEAMVELETERQQIIDARADAFSGVMDYEAAKIDAEQYYKETYGE